MTEAASGNEPITISYLTKGAAHTWEHTILNQATFYVEKNIKDYQLFGPRPLPDYQIREASSDQANQVLNEIYNIEMKLDRENDQHAYLRRKKAMFNALASDIKHRNDFEIFPTLFASIRSKGKTIPDVVRKICEVGVSAVYLLICEPNRFLVGTKDGAVFREVNIPLLKGEEPWQAPIFRMSELYSKTLHLIGRRESIVVPKYPIHPNLFTRIRVPSPQQTLEEILEDAYYRQRYLVPTEGAQIQLQRAGDLNGITMIQARNLIMAKLASPVGENLVYLDLAEGIGGMALGVTASSDYAKNGWINFMAETYRDLVTAEEISTTNPRPLGSSIERKTRDLENTPTVIYIPRKVRVGQSSEPRLPYEGPTRPVKPHKVEGYRRRGNMTKKHRAALEKYEIENEVKVLHLVPEGYTWVRTFSVPKAVEMNVKDLPQFIKRRVAAEFAKQFTK